MTQAVQKIIDQWKIYLSSLAVPEAEFVAQPFFSRLLCYQEERTCEFRQRISDYASILEIVNHTMRCFSLSPSVMIGEAIRPIHVRSVNR